jgi:hypothetical protein
MLSTLPIPSSGEEYQRLAINDIASMFIIGSSICILLLPWMNEVVEGEGL